MTKQSKQQNRSAKLESQPLLPTGIQKQWGGGGVTAAAKMEVLPPQLPLPFAQGAATSSCNLAARRYSSAHQAQLITLYNDLHRVAQAITYADTYLAKYAASGQLRRLHDQLKAEIAYIEHQYEVAE